MKSTKWKNEIITNKNKKLFFSGQLVMVWKELERFLSGTIFLQGVQQSTLGKRHTFKCFCVHRINPEMQWSSLLSTHTWMFNVKGASEGIRERVGRGGSGGSL